MTPANRLPGADGSAASLWAKHEDAEQIVMMCLSVKADRVSLMREAVVAACGKSVRFLRSQIIPRSTRVRVWLVLAETSVPEAMRATLQAVPHGEIGRVFYQVQNQPKA